jgi:tetratricopeptide (TPR) repeat protein
MAMIAAIAVFAPARAAAQSREVVELFEQGLAAYREGRYEDAAALFERAHEMEVVPDLSYNRARALENLGRAGEAAAAYRLYLEEMPDAPDRRGIEERIRTLDARAAEARRLEEARARLDEERARLERERTSAAPPAAPRGGRSFEPAPWAVLGSGVAVVVAGAVVAAVAQATHDRAAGRDLSQVESDRLEAEANDLAIAANVVMAVGGLAAAIGFFWSIADLFGGGGERPAAAPVVSLGPGSIAVSGAF